MTMTTAARQVLRLARCGKNDPGRPLGLRTGDVLIAVAGQPWHGSPEALRARLGKEGTLLVTFLRDDTVMSVLTDQADLGRWERIAPPSALPSLPQPDARLCNWQIMRRHDGEHDLFALRPQMLALLVPPLWLAQERLYTWLAALGSALALALPGGWLLMALVWVAAGLHLWRQGPAHMRAARLAAGYLPVAVLAGRSASEARAAWEALSPGARFRFDSMRPASGAVTEQPAA